jgi:hypothetical protein
VAVWARSTGTNTIVESAVRPASTGTWELPPPTSPRPAGTRSPSRSRSIHPATLLAVWPAPTAPSRPCRAPRGRRPARLAGAGRSLSCGPERDLAAARSLRWPGQCRRRLVWLRRSSSDRSRRGPPASPSGPAIAGGNPGPAAVPPAALQPPVISGARLTHVHFRTTRGTSFRLRLSVAATLSASRAARTGPTPPRHMRGSDRSAGLAARATARAR